MKITVLEKTDTQDDDAVCWHNMRIADAICDINLFFSATVGWFSIYPDKTFQDLEKELRDRNFTMHLVATTDLTLQKNEHIEYPSLKMKASNNGVMPIYICIASTVASSSPAENFTRLKLSGIKTITPTEDEDECEKRSQEYKQYLSTLSQEEIKEINDGHDLNDAFVSNKKVYLQLLE